MAQVKTPSFTIAKHRSWEYLMPDGRQFTLSFTAAVGEFNRNFTTNVRVGAFATQRLVRYSVAIDTTKPNYSAVVRDAVGFVKDSKGFEKMRHTLLDFNEVPPRIEGPLISSMSRLAVAETIGEGDMFAGHTARLLVPMAFAYDRAIRQQHQDLHDRIYNLAQVGGERARSDAA